MKNQLISKIILITTDSVFFSLSAIFSYAILYINVTNIEDYIPNQQLGDRVWIHIFLSSIGVIWFWIRLRHYTYRKPFWFELKEILRTVLILAIFELAIMSFSKLYTSRWLWLLVWGIALILVPLGRILMKKALISSGLYLKNTIIIGGGNNAIDAYKALISEPYLGFKIKYFISLNCNEKITSLGVPVINETKQNIWQLVTRSSDQFIIALEDNESEHRDQWLRYFSKKNYRAVSVIPTLRGLPLYSTDMAFLFSQELILLRVNNNLAKRSSRILKRLIDIIGSSSLIVIFFPVFILFSILIKKDGGNIFYGHSRIGQNGKIFKCWKFRTMVNNSQEILDELLCSDPNAKEEWQKDFKLKNDPRVTKLGRFMRKYSLDELPQLFNVFIGQMSLVGPRPIIADELAFYQKDVDYYLMAKPGMTGLWQVSGRNDVDYETRVYFDSWYVKNWSLWNDIAILFKTVNVVLNRKGAY